MPFKTADQEKTLKNLLVGSPQHMTWWLAPNPGYPYSDVYVLVDSGHFKVKPDGECVEVGCGEYQAEWGRAFRSGLGIFEEFHRLTNSQFEKLKER